MVGAEMRIRWRGLELPSRVAVDRDTRTGTYGKFVAEPFERVLVRRSEIVFVGFCCPALKAQPSRERGFRVCSMSLRRFPAWLKM